MRIIKLSPKDEAFKKREMVDEFFLDTLPKRNPVGKFLLTKNTIGSQGISPGEQLIFTYKVECVYKARAASYRQNNSPDEDDHYPYYFLVDVASIEPIQGNLKWIQCELEQAGVADKNLVTSRAWLTFPEGGLVAKVIDACVSPAQGEVEEIVLQTLEREQARGQGFILDKKLRLALEAYAMDAAKTYFKSKGFLWEDHSKNHPYDLRCSRGKEVLYVEVKGTQTKGEQIFLTNGEVKFADSQNGQMALFILHSITKSKGTTDWQLAGGERRLILPWDVDRAWLTPVSFLCRIPEGKV